jgi:hypothetical protein
MRTDTLHRRLRTEPPNPKRRPPGAPLRLLPTEADYLVFEALDRHGPLPIHYLYEFQKSLRPSYRHFQYRLRDLYHGDNEGSFLTRPSPQFAAYEARYQHLVYDLSPRGRHALGDRGTRSPFSTRRYDPFVHQLMTSCVTSSLELLAPERNIRFVGRDEILSRSTCPPETRQSSNPLAIQIGARVLIPDALFGLEYKDKGYRFFALEADRNTESIYSRQRETTTFAKKIDEYRTVLRDRLYKAQWGLPNLSILTVTTNAAHAINIVKHITQTGEREHDTRFLFQSEADFGANWRVPKTLLYNLLGKPWDRGGGTKKIDVP